MRGTWGTRSSSGSENTQSSSESEEKTPPESAVVHGTLGCVEFYRWMCGHGLERPIPLAPKRFSSRLRGFWTECVVQRAEPHRTDRTNQSGVGVNAQADSAGARGNGGISRGR